MRKKFLKLMAMIIAMVSVFTLVTACGGNKDKGYQQDEKGYYRVGEDGNKVYKIVMMDHGIPETTKDYKYRQLVLDEINKRLLRDLGYKVEFEINVYADDTFADVLATTLADGTQLDIVRQASKDNLTSYVSQGIAKNIAKYTDAATNLQANIPDKMWAEAQYDGGTYAIPLDKLPVNTVGFIRGDLLQKAGYNELKTLQDWEGFLKKVRDGGSEYLDSRMDTIPLMGAFSSFEQMFLGYFTNTPGNFFNGEGKIRPQYFDPGYKQFILKMREWLKEGYIDSSIYNFNEFSMSNYVTSQITGAVVTGIYHLEFGSLLNVNKAHPEWAFTPALPVPTAEGKYASPGMMGEYLFVPYSAKSAGVAVEFMDWAIYNKDNYMLVRCGIEGTTYVVKEDNSLDIPESEKTASVTDYTDLIGRFAIGTSVAFNMGYPSASCPEGAKKAYADTLEIGSDKLYIDPTIYVTEKLTDREVAIMASANQDAARSIQNLLTLNKDGSFKVSDQDFETVWNNMLSAYEGIAVYDKLTTEYNKKFPA